MMNDTRYDPDIFLPLKGGGGPRSGTEGVILCSPMKSPPPPASRRAPPPFRGRISLAIFVYLWMCFISLPARAVTCYTANEAEAEQAVRIHSELMVIGLNCQHRTPQGQKSYYYQYKDFTARHGDLFAAYERVLIGYFARAGFKNPEGALNQLRTQLANKISGDAAKMRPDLFCTYYAPRIPKAAAMKPDQIRTWASTFFRAHPLTQPICANVNVKMR
jgi:hypothetical protein